MKYKIGDKIVLIKDFPDENRDLKTGMKGTIVDFGQGLLPLKIAFLGKDSSKFREHYGRDGIWWCSSSYVALENSAHIFRKQLENETDTQYRICEKIHELDLKFKERKNETNSLSV